MYRQRERNLGYRKIELAGPTQQIEAKRLLDETVPTFARHSNLEENTVARKGERYVIVNGSESFTLNLEYIAERGQTGKLIRQTEKKKTFIRQVAEWEIRNSGLSTQYVSVRAVEVRNGRSAYAGTFDKFKQMRDQIMKEIPQDVPNIR